MKYISFSEKGPRVNNEDSFSIVDVSGKRTMFAVCDGMGGHANGDVASRIVCNTFSEYWRQNPEEQDSEQKIMAATKIASESLDMESGQCQMGTTLVMCSIEGQQATVAHAGDSRCYIIDIKGNVKCRTIDHVDSGSLSHPYINKAFFTNHAQDAMPDVKAVQLQPLDRILLCSDGLYNAIDDETLLHTLQCARDVEQVAEKYRAICKENANDNYTAIIIEIE